MTFDEPRHDDLDRYALYTVRDHGRTRLAETSLDGIGLALVTLLAEGEFGPDGERTPFGLFDRRDRYWVVNPWTRRKGDRP